MLTSNENRFQYVYFILSGIVATTLLVLTYICVKTTENYNIQDDLRFHQKSINFKKPLVSKWNYNNNWSYVGDPSFRHQIFSAYFDVRVEVLDNIATTTDIPVGSFRVFAILPTDFNEVVSCIIRYENNFSKEIKAEHAKPLPEHHDQPFSAFSIMCPFRVNRQWKNIDLPKSIAITYAKNRLSHIRPTFIPISYPRNMTKLLAKSEPKISVCVGPIFGPYIDVMRIVEFIEMYRILGADHFYFYNLSSTTDVQRVLEHYHKQGIVDILNWNLQDHAADVHSQGIVAQFNDCVYRASIVDNFRYAVIVDLDELFMPMKHNSLANYLHQCDEGRTSGFVFRNVFFFKNDSLDSFSKPPHIRNGKLYTQTRVRRSLEIQPVHERSKCVVNARSIVVMRNHFVGEALPGYTETYVHPNVGLLFHYRDKCINCKAVLVTDYAARRFGSLIWDRVDATCLQVFIEKGGVCPLA